MSRSKPRRSLAELDFSRPKFNVSDETKKSIAAVVLILLGIVCGLSLIDLAGTVGIYLNNFLTLLFGGLRWLAVPLLLVVGWVLLRSGKYELTFSNYFGLVLIVLGLPGLVHLASHSADLLAAAKAGQGGGFIGLVFSYLLFNLMGFWASLVVIGGLLVIGLFLFFNTSFADLSAKSNQLTDLKDSLSEALLRRRVRKVQQEKERLYEQTAGLPEEAGFEKRTVQVYDDTDSEGEEKTKVSQLPVKELTAEEKERADLDSGVAKFKQIKIDLPLDLLTGKTGTPNGGDIEANKAIIKKTLANFDIAAEMGEAQVGPTVTQYTLKPAEGVKLSRITALNDNLALALAAHPIRIEAPIPGRSMVGIEVPNAAKAIVPVRDVLLSEQFKKRKSNLMLALGLDVMGRSWLADLKKMPHLLIAGSTGSGKSVAINSIIISLLYQNGPGELKFILVDPKRVELPIYNGIPHLLTPVITNVKKTVNALRWAVGEMERRFELLSQFHKRNIESYNQEMPDKIPYIVFIIDELADLMAASAAEVEAAIIRLAQMARAVGIHLILATQRPSVDVLTGLIKANITSRIAFSVASIVDSRTILDMAGAEKLLGRGDMLYISAELGKPKRLQGALTSDEEIKRVVEYLHRQAEPQYVEAVIEKQAFNVSSEDATTFDETSDPLLPEAKEVIVQARKASASLLQRRLRVGYARAARLLDLLEGQGFIGPGEGAKPREVLLNRFERDTMPAPGSVDQPEVDVDDDSSQDQAEEGPEEELEETTEEEEDNQL